MNPHKKNNKPFYIFFGLTTYLFMLYLSLRASTLQILNIETSFSQALIHILDNIWEAPFLIQFSPKYSFSAIGITTLIFIAIAVFVIIEAQKNHHDMAGEESGSAKWNDDINAYNKKYSDPCGSTDNSGKKNMIFTDKISLSMESFKTRRNCNAVILGGSGAGKSRFFVKPNILQANSNYVITDPAGELLESTGEFLRQQGYEIKVFNLVEMQKSNCYNPFHYIRDDQGVLMMINCLIKNTNQDGQKGGDPFWEKSETALLQALCFYLIKYRPVEEQNFSSVMRLLRAAEVDENNPNHKSELDKIFDDIALNDPDSIALKQYRTFKMGAGKTLKSILISCSVRLTVFNLQQIENLTRVDNIHLEELGGTGKKQKQALFVIIPAADNTFNFLVSMMYSQLFETLYYLAETSCQKQRLPRHVRFLLDEFANIGQIPEFTNKLATMRKYEISCSIILQNLAQIKTMYKDDWETIIGNSDSFLFLGGKEFSTLEYISKELGNQTITVKDRSNSQGKSGSSSKSYKQTSRALMFPDELGNIPDSHCVFMLRGVDPFYDKKYDYTKHPQYKNTGDASSNNKFINTIDNSASGQQFITLDQCKIFYAKRQKEESVDIKQILAKQNSADSFLKKLATSNTSDLFNEFVILSSDNITNDNVDNSNTLNPLSITSLSSSKPTSSNVKVRILNDISEINKRPIFVPLDNISSTNKTTSTSIQNPISNPIAQNIDNQHTTILSVENNTTTQEINKISEKSELDQLADFEVDFIQNNSDNTNNIFDFNFNDDTDDNQETSDFSSWFN